jgi:hypothetical protein
MQRAGGLMSKRTDQVRKEMRDKLIRDLAKKGCKAAEKHANKGK